MFKKIALACIFFATASFATWDFFPVLENHKGETRIGATFAKQGKPMALVPYVGSRYTVLPNLELAMIVPYYVHLNINNENGLSNPEFMVRYQFLPFLNAFLDVEAPINKAPYTGDAWEFYFGTQYSQKFGIVNLGSELGFGLETSGDNDITPPFFLHTALEADFEFGIPVIPLIGAGATMEIGKYSRDGKSYGNSHTGHMQGKGFGGARFVINPAFNVEATGAVIFGKHLEEDKPLYAHLKINMML